MSVGAKKTKRISAEKNRRARRRIRLTTTRVAVGPERAARIVRGLARALGPHLFDAVAEADAVMIESAALLERINTLLGVSPEEVARLKRIEELTSELAALQQPISAAAPKNEGRELMRHQNPQPAQRRLDLGRRRAMAGDTVPSASAVTRLSTTSLATGKTHPNTEPGAARQRRSPAHFFRGRK